MLSVVDNAYKKYCKTRPVASNTSIKRVKAMANTNLGYHPLFGQSFGDIQYELKF